MNYYERHLGDYARDTAHLSMLEHGAYTLLLDRYYATEQGIPADQAHRVARARSRDEKAAVDAVLGEYFRLDGGVWTHGRVQEEITKAQDRINAARNNGRKGGRPKKHTDETQSKPSGFSDIANQETEQKPSGFSLGSISETQMKAHQAPDTTYQEKPPVSPKGGAKRDRSITLADYLADCHRQGIEPIPGDDAVWGYPESMGFPASWVDVAWWAFQGRYLTTTPGEKAKRYTSWPQAFRNAVRENWLKLWWVDGNGYRLTTAGVQAQREMETAA